jgi:hypothetical protein
MNVNNFAASPVGVWGLNVYLFVVFAFALGPVDGERQSNG